MTIAIQNVGEEAGEGGAMMPHVRSSHLSGLVLGLVFVDTTFVCLLIMLVGYLRPLLACMMLELFPFLLVANVEQLLNVPVCR